MRINPLRSPRKLLWDILQYQEYLANRIDTLENSIMALRDDFSDALAQLGQSIADLTARIAALPPASDITQADIDALKADSTALGQLAVETPEVPTPDQPSA